MTPDPIVGTPTPRKEGRDKVNGRARYIDDITVPNMLYGATVRTRIPRGKIKKISFGPGIAWKEYVVVSAKDIPGKNYVALIENDQPCLADGVVNHPEEAILLLAHPDRRALAKATQFGPSIPLTVRFSLIHAFMSFSAAACPVSKEGDRARARLA